jgi:xanthine dehydrogenase FAD-binding subunit
MFQLNNYQKANSVREAIELLKENADARLIAGGTDVLIRLREGKKEFAQLVDIHDLEELKQLTMQDDGTLIIGSGVTFSMAMESDLVLKNIPILAEACATIGGPQVRNVATIGGNVCNGVTSADSASSLFVLNAILNLEGPDGNRRVPIADFYKGPGKVDLNHGEVLTAFIIRPQNYQNCFGVYYKYAMRNAMDIATIGCAAVCRIENNHLEELRLSYGVAGPVPIRCSQTEAMVKGKTISDQLIKDIGDSVVKDVNPRTSWRASKEFRLQIISELARRVVRNAIEKAGGSF